MQLKISHSTRYTFARPVAYALQQIRLTPVSSRCQTVIDWHTDIEGGRTEADFSDQHGNRVQLVSLLPDTQELVMHSRGSVQTHNVSGVFGRHDRREPLWCLRRATALTAPGQAVQRLVANLGGAFADDIARLHALAAMIGEHVRYETGKTSTVTSAEDALEAGYGVCQDHTHVFLSAARVMGYPARYVSGYLMMNDRIDQEASHAWAEAHVAELGWVGFDVSNGISPDERYVRLAIGLDYNEAAPVKGITLGENDESMQVNVQVQQ